MGEYRPFGASLVVELVENPPAMQETPVQFLGWDYAWRIPMDRGAWQATVHEVAKSGTRLSN